MIAGLHRHQKQTPKVEGHLVSNPMPRAAAWPPHHRNHHTARLRPHHPEPSPAGVSTGMSAKLPQT